MNLAPSPVLEFVYALQTRYIIPKRGKYRHRTKRAYCVARQQLDVQSRFIGCPYKSGPKKVKR